MKKYIAPLVLLASCAKEVSTSNNAAADAKQPALTMQAAKAAPPTNRPDHIVVVWLENKAYSQIIGSSSAPYINSLVPKGTLFTNSYALFHPSYSNYIAWFCGSNYGVINDNCINTAKFGAPTLYNALQNAGRTFLWASEDLPAAGSTTCISGHYVAKHNPTTIFKTVPASVNVPLSDINLSDSATFDDLPNVLSVTPNMMNDMHDGTVQQGDSWIKSHFSKYITWAMTHNSVFIVYFDEDNRKTDNRIPVIAVGQYIKPDYKASEKYTHYSFAKAILTWNGADTTFHSHYKHAASIQNIWQ